MRPSRAGLPAIKLIGSGAAILLWCAPPLAAQSGPSKLRGPAIEIGRQAEIDQAALEKERFRRKAAEAGQKQLEQLAEQLRQQLAEEVLLRKTTEARIIELTARLTLTDQLDQERQKLRDDKIRILEERRTILERDVAELKVRLAAEGARRQELEKTTPPPGSTKKQLAARVKELQEKLKAEEWARKLAEAQLKLYGARPAQ